MITPEEIKRLRELEKKATPGPWEVGDNHLIFAADHKRTKIAGNYRWEYGRGGICFAADGDFIVAARNALPDLLDEIERLRWLADHIDDQIAKKLAGMQSDLAAALKRAEKAEADANRLQEALIKEKRLSDGFYLLMVDNHDLKIMADKIHLRVMGGAK